jgi:CRISPR-associated endonuclease/helicase Cas3
LLEFSVGAAEISLDCGLLDDAKASGFVGSSVAEGDFSGWVARVTGREPFPYQTSFATATELAHMLNVPTGAGKTATIVLSWLWRRHFAEAATRSSTPRRLVYCLPMRTLVEQTYAEVERWLEQADLTDEVGLHCLMGGAVSQQWEALPEKDCILIGTQDQLLSRALNRGYGMSRYKWSMHFALLNNDCLWCMDEVQLMGAGLKTTAQLQGFREHFQTYGAAPKSIWMSATLDLELLQTVDHPLDSPAIQQLTDADLAHPILKQRMEAKKVLFRANTVCQGKDGDYAKVLAQEVIAAHVSGTLSIVICNRVNRAQALYQALQKKTSEPLLLIHSRFRAADRQALNQKLRASDLSGILVATQAIEAGVDISARVMFTELAPWSSLVQRIGRCNRRGEYEEDAKVYWIDMLDVSKKGSASPYETEPLEESRSLLQSLIDVGIESLKRVEAKAQQLEGLLPRKHDLLQLFDTSTDLAGHDIDVSSFIRETEETDVAIAWRTWEEVPPLNQPDPMGALQQEELCRVGLYNARAFLEDLKKRKRHAWMWERLHGRWVGVEPLAIYPGMNLLVHCSDGGYSSELGFTGSVNDKKIVEVLLEKPIEPDQNDADLLTNIGQYMTLKQHANDTALEVQKLSENLSDYDLPIALLERAGRWHDAGKAHPDFQEMMTRDRLEYQTGELWAKSDHKARIKAERRGFRHELVSALVALQMGEPFLLCYLVAAHHGKVRMMIQPRPHEKRLGSSKLHALGVWDGDKIPTVDLGDSLVIPNQEISLACMELGGGAEGESWTAQAIALLEEYGPFRLAFLETLIRVGDWRASSLQDNSLGETKDV